MIAGWMLRLQHGLKKRLKNKYLGEKQFFPFESFPFAWRKIQWRGRNFAFYQTTRQKTLSFWLLRWEIHRFAKLCSDFNRRRLFLLLQLARHQLKCIDPFRLRSDLWDDISWWIETREASACKKVSMKFKQFSLIHIYSSTPQSTPIHNGKLPRTVFVSWLF